MRDRIRVLHAADLHMDSPFEALSGEKAAIRRAEQRALLGKIAELAREREVDLVLLAGDLLDSGSAYRETALMLRQTLAEMEAKVFIAPGNHDFYSPRSVWALLELPENVHVFRSNEIECVSLPELDTEVFGAAFTEESCPALLRDFTPPENPENRLRVMCLHGEVGSGEGKYNPMTEAQLASGGMHYVALGHIHACSGLRHAGATCYAWPGCAEGRGFDECGEKGVYITEITRGGCSAEFVPIAARQYHRLEVDLSGGKDALEAVLQALPECAERDIFRIALRGETATAPKTEQLRAVLSERVFALRLRDETRPETDIWARAEEDSLRGEFLRRMREKLDSATDETARARLLMALRFGLAAMDNAEEPRG